MTTLICTGTPFSNWRELSVFGAEAGPQELQVREELSAFCEKICRQHFPDSPEMNRAVFAPDEELYDQVREIHMPMEDEDLFSWADANSALCLDFWRSAVENARFVLFYSSPDHELSCYLENHAFDEAGIGAAVNAWLVRTQAMLAFFMKHREQCLMINVRSAALEPRLFAKSINDRFNLAVPDLPPAGKAHHDGSALVNYLAFSLLLDNPAVSELYDEVCSAATAIREQDKSITGIRSRRRSMIVAFMNEVETFRQLAESNRKLQDDLTLMKLQNEQVMEEVNYYFDLNKEQEQLFAYYLASDPFLSIARRLRQSK